MVKLTNNSIHFRTIASNVRSNLKLEAANLRERSYNLARFDETKNWHFSEIADIVTLICERMKEYSILATILLWLLYVVS